MIDLASPPRRRADPIVPMINVAFLLLIFFLMVAVIAPPDPDAVEPPLVASAELLSAEAHTVTLGGDGAFLTISPEDLSGQIVVLRAEANLPAALVAGALRELAQAGAADIRLLAIEK